MKVPIVKPGDKVLVIKTSLDGSFWSDPPVGRVCTVRSVYEYAGHECNDITVSEDSSWCLRYTDGEWIPLDLKDYIIDESELA